MTTSFYLDNNLLNFVFGNEIWTPPTTIYAALYTTAPNDMGGGIEVIGNGYFRKALTNNTTTFPTTTTGIKTNGIIIEWSPATGSWGTIVALGLHTSSNPESSQLLCRLDIDNPILVETNRIFRIPVGSLYIQRGVA